MRRFTKPESDFRFVQFFLIHPVVKKLILPPQRTLDLEYQDGGDEPQNLITETTTMRDYSKPIVAIFNNGLNIIFKHSLIEQMF